MNTFSYALINNQKRTKGDGKKNFKNIFNWSFAHDSCISKYYERKEWE